MAIDHTNKNPWKVWVMGNPPIPLMARKSPGGAFYDIRVIDTGMEARYLAEVFEINAKEVSSEAS